MIEDKDITNITNDKEIHSFKIKPEWLDDMSEQLDIYNAKQKMALRYRWFLLLIPAIVLIVMLIPSSRKNTQLHTANSFVKNELIQDQTAPINKTVALPNQKSAENIEIQAKNTEKISLNNTLSKVSPIRKLKPLEIALTGTNDNVVKSTITKKDHSKTVKNTLSDLSSKFNASVNSNTKKLVAQTKLKVNNSDKSIKSAQNQATPMLVKNTSNQTEPTTIATNPDNFEKNGLEANSEKLKLEKTDTTSLLEHTKILPKTPETISKKPIVDSSRTKEEIVERQVLMDSSLIKTDAVSLITEHEDKVEKMAKDDETKTKVAPSEKEEDIKIDQKGSKDKPWMIGLTMGPDFLTKEITTSSDLLNFEQKNKEELIDNTWGYNFELSRQLTPWLALGTGVGFKKYKEVNSYSSETSVTIDTTYVIENISFMYIDSTIADSVLIPNFLTVRRISNDTVVDSSNLAANGTVTSSYIQFPINAQLTFINTKKLAAYTNLGLTVGLLTKNTGVVLDYTTNEIITYTTKTMNYNANIGLGLNYNLFGPLDIKLYGAYQFNLTNLSNTPNVDKRYNGYNIRSGLVFHF